MNRKRSVCEEQGVKPSEPLPGSKVGIAISTIGKNPINGLRHSPENGTNGWYIWCGEEYSEEPSFFEPLHVEHLSEYLPGFVDYLSLPPGFRVLIDDQGYEDVWIDEKILDV